MFLAATSVVSYSLHPVSRFVPSYFSTPVFPATCHSWLSTSLTLSAGLFVVQCVGVSLLVCIRMTVFSLFAVLYFYWARLVLGFHTACGSDGTRAFLLEFNYFSSAVLYLADISSLFTFLGYRCIRFSILFNLEFLPTSATPGADFTTGLGPVGVLSAPCTRDPTFHPCILSLRPGLRYYACLYEVGAKPAA